MTRAGGPGVGRDQARELARRELARSIYRPSLLSRWWHDIARWLSSLFSPSRVGEPDWLIVAVLAVVVIVAVVAVLYWLGSPRASRRQLAAPVTTRRPRSAAQHRPHAA